MASGGKPAALHVTDETARHLRYTSRAKREADVSLSHRCTMEHPLHHGAPRCDGCYHPETTVKASAHRHKWMLSHGAPTDPSDPWNFHAAPISFRVGCSTVVIFCCRFGGDHSNAAPVLSRRLTRRLAERTGEVGLAREFEGQRICNHSRFFRDVDKRGQPRP